MANTKNQSLGLRTKTIIFLSIACSHENQGRFLPWIVNTNVSTCFFCEKSGLSGLSSLACCCCHCVSRNNSQQLQQCAEWFTDCATDETINPTRKFPNPLGIGSSNDMRAPNNKLGQRTVDSASEVTWKIGPSLGGDSQTCKNHEQCFCQKMGEGCHFAVAVVPL